MSPQPPESTFVLGGPREGGARRYTGRGPSKQWGRGLGAIAPQSTLSRAGQLAVPSRGTSAQGQVHGIQVGQARVQGSHGGAEGCRTPGEEGRREAAWTKSWASCFLPTLWPTPPGEVGVKVPNPPLPTPPAPASPPTSCSFHTPLQSIRTPHRWVWALLLLASH